MEQNQNLTAQLTKLIYLLFPAKTFNLFNIK